MHCMWVLLSIHTALFVMKKNSCRKKVVIHTCQTPAGEAAVSDGGRFKGQAAGVTHSGQCVPFH